MTNERPNSQASYAYYSFPPTPNRNSPSDSSTKSVGSKTPSPHTARSSKSMAPSPAAGKAPQPPKTPTKPGKDPASSSTQKLSQASSSATDSPRATPKSFTNTAKGAAGGDSKSPKLPPRPKAGQAPKLPPKGQKAVDDTKKKVDEPVEEETNNKIDLKDNDPADEADNEETDNPVSEGDPDLTGTAQDTTEGAADETPDTGDAEDTADTADEQSGGLTGKTKGAATGAAGKGKDVTGKAQEGDVEGAAGDAKEGAEDVAGKAQETAEDTVGDAQETAEDTAGDAQETVEDKAGDVQETAKDTADDAQEKAEDTASDAPEAAKGAVGDAKETAEGAAEEAQDGVEDAAGDAQDTAEDVQDGAEDGVDGVQETTEDAAGKLPDLSILKGLEVGEGGEILGADGDPVGQLDEGDPEDLVGKVIGDDGEILDEDGDVIGRASVIPDKAEQLADKAKDSLPEVGVLEGLEVGEGGEILGPDGTPLGKITEGDPEYLVGMTLNENGEILDEDGDVIGRAEVVPGEAAEKLKGTAEDAGEGAGEGVGEGVGEDAGEAVEGVAAKAGGLTPDLSILEGKKINKKGNILDDEGEPIGKLTEDSDLSKCAGKIPNKDGLIIDDDGNIVGKVEVVPGEAADEAMKALHPELLEEVKGATEDAEEAAPDAEDAEDAVPDDEAPEIPGLPDLEVLEGLKLSKKGEVLNEDGEPIAKLVEGELADCAGKKINANGEVVDKDGNVIGKVELIPEAFPEVAEAAEAAELSVLDGLKVNKKGEVVNEDGDPIAKLVEGELADCVGKKINGKGEVVDAEGNVIGRLELIPQEDEEAPKEAVEAGPDYSILEGYKINKKGEVMNEDGESIAKLIEGELADCVGKKINGKGEVVDAEGNVIGRVEMIPQEGEEAAEEAAEAGPDYSTLEGYKVNKNGDVINEDGDTVAKLIEGELADCTGKKINGKGEVLDAEGNVIGKVEMIPQEGEEEQAAEAGPDFSILEGYKVNKNGDVVNEDGDTLARLIEGEIADCAGKKINDQGEVLDKEGNVIGKVELVVAEAEEEDTGPQLPPLSILEGCKCNKNGKVVDASGKPLGELIEGDAKRLSKLGAECDAEGQFFDKQGKVIGRAQTLPQDDESEEAPFAGLEGLIVVPDGYVEDENQNKVGQLVEGDPKKLVGRAVDEDGDVIDKHGNVVGHAERLPEEEEEEVPDLSILKGLTLNKQGNVIGPQGVPIARLVEGNVKELAGKTCDEFGQIWNDQGAVIGRCELIPDNEREAKPEGPFAGLEGCIVVKDGFVEDEDGNRVGYVVEGDTKRLVGRAVDEDGDIIDKFGNVKGHAEPYDEPEEEVADLSSLEGKVVNKAGKVVDEHGTIYGRIAEGDPEELAGKKVDGQGQIWSDNGKVIGQAELIPGGGTRKPEGSFAGFENVVVAKDGLVTDAAGQVVGKVIEGDPEKLLGRRVDADGDILDTAGNPIGKAERYTPEEKERTVNPMSGHKVNKDGEVRDENGELLGLVTDGHLPTLVGKEVDDNGYVIDNDGNKVGECTLLANIEEPPEEEEQGLTEEELEKLKDADLAKKMNAIVVQTIEKMQPICKDITDLIDAAERKPKDELDEEELVKNVKPKIEEGGRILQECNGAIRGLDPDGHIAANAKARSASGEATKEEHALANSLKELTTTIVTTIENAKKKIADMPHAKKALNPLWYLLTEPLFQIIAAVGLLLSGVLGLVGKLLNGLGLGGLVNGLLGGLGIDKLLGGLGLGSITKSLGLGGKKK